MRTLMGLGRKTVALLNSICDGNPLAGRSVHLQLPDLLGKYWLKGQILEIVHLKPQKSGPS